MRPRIAFTKPRTSERSEDQADRLAYTLVERARLRCEGILGEEPESEQLLKIHSHLGLAGYHVSNDFSPALRMSCLEIARTHCELEPACRASLKLEKMLQEAIIASDAMVTMMTHGPQEHVHRAHFHVISARGAIDRELVLATGQVP